MSLHDRVLGCLLGGACGDALGAPVEFLTRAEIQTMYGPGGITDFTDIIDDFVGAVTDETQMLLFTVEGLIVAYLHHFMKGECHTPTIVHRAYLRWFATQGGSFFTRSHKKGLAGWLAWDDRLWERRATGNTCMTALHDAVNAGQPAKNDSKGSGTVGRDAPFGFVARVTGVPQAFNLAVETARTTHGHPSACFSSGALAATIAHIVEGNDVQEAVERTLPILQRHKKAGEVRAALENALRLRQEHDWRDHLSELGEGWHAEDALAIAVLCALAAETPREAIIAAVNHGGASDTTGAITGNIVGALHGPSCLPNEWAEHVELRDAIEVLAQDFTAVIEGRAHLEELGRQYPGR